jgi:hypothetical protein
MTPQEIMQALKIPEDLPPWDGEIREVRASILDRRVRVLSVVLGWALVQFQPHGVMIPVRCDRLRAITLLY